ncbi:MAG TPA: type VI secretion system baseplate subunit TssK [Gemmatimonadales bacterium]|jgi:type VI secretion system protein ImpJ
MKHLSRVVWNEGMYLAQHHFQLQGRYFEDSLQFALAHLFFKSYGLAGYELDREALLNGTVALIHGRGVLPDGLPFHMPESDPLPPPREIRGLFSPTQDSHLVLLAIPAFRLGGANCATSFEEADSQARYVAQSTLVPDDTTGGDEKPVVIGRKNFRLRLDDEVGEGEVALPLARVRRDGAGHFVYDPEYVPPCVQIGASERLLLLTRRLLEILEAKSAAMEAERRASRKDLREYASHEVANFWLLHAVRSSMAPLRHHLELKHTHPEQLYSELARLAGALCTFALDADPRSLPVYDHDRLGECFAELDRHIRKHLEIIIPTNCISIPFKRVREYLYAAPVNDQRCFGRSQWLLGVRSEIGRAELITRVPSLVKICSSKHVERLVKEAYEGLTLHHLPSPPAAVSPKVGTEYFTIGRSGGQATQACWASITQTREVGVYAPAAIAAASLELLIVLES